MNYNTGKKYNFKANQNGLTYNSIGFSILINLYETLSPKDVLPEILARVIIQEKNASTDSMFWQAFFNYEDSFYLANESVEQFALFELSEKLNIKPELVDTLVFLQLNDKFSLIDQFKELNALITLQENKSIIDDLDFKALIELAESNNLNDVAEWLAFMELYEYPQILDRDPRTALSDFFLGKIDEFDAAYDWITPFDLIVDWRNTEIQIMPQTESDYIDLPNVDGSIIENTVYKNRLFNIVAWTQDGLTVQEKEQIKQDIAYILDSTKNQNKKMTFGNTGNTFDVKYSGVLGMQEAPSSIKFTIPFEASAYGYPVIDQLIYGSGLLINNGDKDSAPVHIINGGCVNPSFQLGDIVYSWAGTVPENSKLYINHSDYTCYLESVEGTRTNVLNKLTGEFQQIGKGKSLPINCFGDTANYLMTTLKEFVLW